MRTQLLSLCAAALCATLPAFAAETALLERSETTRIGNYHWTNLSEAALNRRLRDTGSNLIDLEVAGTSPMRFNAVAVRNSGPYRADRWWYFGQTERQVNDLLDTHDARLTDLEVYDTPAGLRFAVIMKKNRGADQVRWRWAFDASIDQLKSLYRAHGMKVVDIERYRAGGRTRFAAIMADNRGASEGRWAWYVNQTADQVAAKMATHRMRLVDIERHRANGRTLFDIVLRPYDHGDQHHWWYHGVPSGGVAALLRRHGARVIDSDPAGSGRVDVLLIDNGIHRAGHCGGRLRHFGDRVTEVMKLNDIPGAQVAVVKDGRLVYSCALGVAELQTGKHVAPDSLFRIMSISKLITASAVRLFADEGRFSLGDTMLSALGDRAPDGPFADARMRDVKVRNLLNHRSGLHRDIPYDPMVRQDLASAAMSERGPLGCRQIMEHTIKTFPLNFTPGSDPTQSGVSTGKAYSNVAYCILQQIIAEHGSGSYQQIVQRRILEPAGITRMRIGYGREQDRAPGEVGYYHRPLASRVTSQYPDVAGKVTLPYSYVVEAMAGHGGWLASANDLVRYAAFTPAHPERTGIVQHGGWLPGSCTRLQQVGDVHVAILTNGSPKVTCSPDLDLGGLIRGAVADVSTWPTRNLWANYGYPVVQN